VIANWKVEEQTMSSITVSWATSAPATSQVIVTDMSTGASITTPSDSILRTIHYVVVRDLRANTTYRLQAVSVTSDGVSAVSNELTWTTDAF